MKPEEKARQQIDQMLEAAGWKNQDLRDINLGASLGVAVREFLLKSGAADYLNFVDREAVGVVEAYQLFGNGLNNILEELNEVLAS